MSLLGKLKSLLGIGGGRSDRRTETTVTVEHETDEATVDAGATADDEADTGSESVADAEPTDATGEAAATDSEPTDTAAADTDTAAAEAETEPDVVGADEKQAADAATEADAEPKGDTDSDAGTDPDASTDSDADTEPDAVETEEDEDDELAAIDEAEPTSDEPLDSIKGIGPAYSERLHNAGITSVSQLADGDAEEIGDAISVSPKTVGDWIDRANTR